MRSSRLLSILIILQLRGRMTAEALAEEFEVSVRTIYRDVDALSAAGVPVYGDKGHGGGFALLNGYRTHLTGLDAEEAQALPLIGLSGPANALGLGAVVERAQNKLLASMSAKGADLAGRMAGRFHFDIVDWYRDSEPTPHLPALFRAVLDQQIVDVAYRSWTGERQHRLQPMGIAIKGSGWYLVAKGRSGIGMFRVASVLSVDILDEPFERDADFDLAAWWTHETARFEAALRADVARLRLSDLGLVRLAEQGQVAAAAVAKAGPPDADGWREVTLQVEGIERAALALLALGDTVVVVEPEALRNEVARQARGMAERQIRFG